MFRLLPQYSTKKSRITTRRSCIRTAFETTLQECSTARIRRKIESEEFLLGDNFLFLVDTKSCVIWWASCSFHQTTNSGDADGRCQWRKFCDKWWQKFLRFLCQQCSPLTLLHATIYYRFWLWYNCARSSRVCWWRGINLTCPMFSFLYAFQINRRSQANDRQIKHLQRFLQIPINIVSMIPSGRSMMHYKLLKPIRVIAFGI